MNLFKDDLQFGQRYELEAVKYFRHKTFEQSKDLFKDYDLKFYKKKSNRYYTVEVKSDRLMCLTGNMCIEYECNNKPSGISTSKATYWAIFEIIDNNNYILYKIKRIDLEKILENKNNIKKVQGGDGLRSKMYLINKSLLKDYIVKMK